MNGASGTAYPTGKKKGKNRLKAVTCTRVKGDVLDQTAKRAKPELPFYSCVIEKSKIKA